MKIPFGVAFLFALLCSALPAEAAKHHIRFLGHPSRGYFEETALRFKEVVEKESRGEISVEIVRPVAEPTEQALPGLEIDFVHTVAKGEAEIGHSYTNVLGSVDRRFLAFDLPYLFRDYRHLEGVYEGPMGKELLGGLREHRLQGLAFTYNGGANGVMTRDREIRRPEDLKGLKVGTYGHAADRAWLKSLGAIPVDINHLPNSFLRMARTGKIDASMMTWGLFKRGDLMKEFKHANLLGSTHLASVIYINQKFFESLPPKHRKLLTDISQDVARVERAETIKYHEDARRQALAKGVREVFCSEENAAAFQKAVAPVYASTYDALVGKTLIERLRKVEPGEFPIDVAGR